MSQHVEYVTPHLKKIYENEAVKVVLELFKLVKQSCNI